MELQHTNSRDAEQSILLAFSLRPRNSHELHQIFTADALRVSLNISSDDATALTMFQDSMDRALLVRLLSSGMESSSILNRLFGDQIAQGKVADADSILWAVHVDSSNPASIRVTVTSSAYWLNALRETESFEWKFVPEAK